MNSEFEWDPIKAASNLQKHTVSFTEASDRGDRIRIISARLATSSERKKYESGVE